MNLPGAQPMISGRHGEAGSARWERVGANVGGGF